MLLHLGGQIKAIGYFYPARFIPVYRGILGVDLNYQRWGHRSFRWSCPAAWCTGMKMCAESLVMSANERRFGALGQGLWRALVR